MSSIFHGIRILLAANLAVLLLAGCEWPPVRDEGSAAASRGVSGSGSVDWPVYGGNAAGQRHSALAQIDRANVDRLQPAWRFDAGPGDLQTSPLVIDGTLYATTPTQKVIALDAATGTLRWEFDPGASSEQPVRGLSWWSEGTEQRLFTSFNHYLGALDPQTGRPVASFGVDGRIDLREGLGRDPAAIAAFLTSPGIVHEDLIITGFRTSEADPAAPGAVRAYDVRTGTLRWIFHLVPQPGEAGHQSWPADAWKSVGGANAWAGMVLDAMRGIVYVPTGSATPDFYGGERAGDNLFANSLVALDADTGKRLWHFQAVHHDLWDRDFPSPPVLLTVQHGGRRIDAVAQTSKQGYVFLFDRVSGAPLFPIEQRPVPPSTVPGEHSAATQPVPSRPAPFARQQLDEDTLTARTPEVRAAALAAWRTFDNRGPFTPLALGDRPTVVFPGFDGGAEWGGPAVDPARGVLYVNSSDVASTGSLAELGALASRGEQVYRTQCAGCHGPDRQGTPPDVPPLPGISGMSAGAAAVKVIIGGRGRMPGFPQLMGADLFAVLSYIAGGAPHVPPGKEAAPPRPDAAPPTRYVFTGYNKFRDPEGYPAVAPPWGTLNAIDLNTGEYLWKIPLGEYPALVAQGMANTGSENYGGPLVTDGGLLFIGATIHDRKFRAFDKDTGNLLWQTELPYAGVATPVTYSVGGRQYVVIAASGSAIPGGRKAPRTSLSRCRRTAGVPFHRREHRVQAELLLRQASGHEHA